MRKRSNRNVQTAPAPESRPRSAFSLIAGILSVSAIISMCGVAGIAWVATPSAGRVVAAAATPAPALLEPPAVPVATSVVAAASSPAADAVNVQVPLPPSFAAALAEQRAALQRLEAQLSALASKPAAAAPAVLPIGLPPLAAPPALPPQLASMVAPQIFPQTSSPASDPLPAINVAQRPEPKRPRDGVHISPALIAAPPAPTIQRRPPVLAAQKRHPEAASPRQATPTQIARELKQPSRPPASPSGAAEAGPRSFKFEDLERIRVGDTIPEWGRVSAVTRENGGISIRTESGIIRKDPP